MYKRSDDSGEWRITARALQQRRHGGPEAVHVVGRKHQRHHPGGCSASAQAGTASFVFVIPEPTSVASWDFFLRAVFQKARASSPTKMLLLIKKNVTDGKQ